MKSTPWSRDFEPLKGCFASLTQRNKQTKEEIKNQLFSPFLVAEHAEVYNLAFSPYHLCREPHKLQPKLRSKILVKMWKKINAGEEKIKKTLKRTLSRLLQN